jgi:hypothetical protein
MTRDKRVLDAIGRIIVETEARLQQLETPCSVTAATARSTS